MSSGCTHCIRARKRGHAFGTDSFPFAVDDHQTKNGEQLQEAGAAMVVQEKDLDIFVAKLSDILRAPKTNPNGAAARSVAKPEATKRLLIGFGDCCG